MGTSADTIGIIRTAPLTPTAPYSPQRRSRVDSVDLLRGLVMVIMMLDHTRDFVQTPTLFDPTDASKTYALLFFTRWITHFCAPVFVFLAGTGAYFQELRGKPKSELSRFLVTRGIWLIFLELTVLRLLILFNVDYPALFSFLQVIWVFGWSMIILAAVIHLPMRVILALSLAMIALHNMLDGVSVTSWAGPGSPVPGFGASLWHILHVPGILFPFGYPGPVVFVLYPLIPWVGVMAAGYAFGSLYRIDQGERRKRLLRLGAAITVGFLIIRAINVYGDASRWSVQSSPGRTALSFLATSKYPPSLLYLMMTLGPALLLLAWSEGREKGRIARFFIVYGRVPLFFYFLQWFTSHLLAVIAGKLAGKPTGYLFGNLFLSGPPAPGSGFGLGMTYVLWILGVLLLYPLCKWYGNVKARRHDWWLSYI
ncbi:MAG TPA: heparan-alpha-glucosaminide N-acetyltransferase domain-containing protein [Gemmatimonadaceae bacterium]|nr:heparan-alpha-glucosaminide N-acetyltransferase domain-containing protein [Gemmatimonadaceae bacterium]